MFHTFWNEFSNNLIDVTIVHPTSVSYLQQLDKALRIAKKAELEKIEKYKAMTTTHQAEFFPFVIEHI